MMVWLFVIHLFTAVTPRKGLSYGHRPYTLRCYLYNIEVASHVKKTAIPAIYYGLNINSSYYFMAVSWFSYQLVNTPWIHGLHTRRVPSHNGVAI